MASLMEDLIDVLNKEEEQYQGLIELGKKKRWKRYVWKREPKEKERRNLI